MHNALTIAVGDGAVQEAVRRAIAPLHIPDDAVTVPIVAPFRFQVAPGQDLKERIDPVIGGTQIIVSPNSFCTVGFNTQKVLLSNEGNYVYDWTHYFVTASHCMPQPGVTGALVAQGPYMTSQYYVGNEARQPYWDRVEHGGCPAIIGCSLADAALVRYGWGRDGSMGDIARTSRPNDFSTTIDRFLPLFVILDSTMNSGRSLAGTLVSKIGKSSGWTDGFVDGTCFDQPAYWPGYWLLCQDSYSAANADGDSGAPIFQVDFSGRYARIAGLHWGGNGTRGAFSPYVYVRWELTWQDFDSYCFGHTGCWLGLTVSSPWR